MALRLLGPSLKEYKKRKLQMVLRRAHTPMGPAVAEYGDWLNHPGRGGFAESLDAMFPGYGEEQEIILYLPAEELEAAAWQLLLLTTTSRL
jgi:hypothetical protein